MFSESITFCTTPSFLRLNTALKLLKYHIHTLFIDAKAVRTHTDSLKLNYMKDQRQKNSAAAIWISQVNRKDFILTDYSKVCSKYFVEGKINNF